MYLALYRHGRLLQHRQSKAKCDASFADMALMLLKFGYSIVSFTPAMMRLACSQHETCGYDPCAVISIQADQPEVPREYVKP